MHARVRGALVTVGGVAVAAALVVGQRPAFTAENGAEAVNPHAGHAGHGAHAAHMASSGAGAAALNAVDRIRAMADAGDIHAGHALEVMGYMQQPGAQGTVPVPANPNLPADNEGAAARLAASPRKGEYVTIDVNGTPMRTWVVLPEGTGKAPVVVVIQEVFGLADWIRGVADQLAKEGFIAVAPDLLAGRGPNNNDSRGFASQQEAVPATLAMPAAEVLAKMKAAREWGVKHARSNGKTASVGFCFGGSQSFALAIGEPGLNAAVVYYGSAPTDQPRPAQGQPAPPFEPSPNLANIKAPVLGLFGGLKEDARIGVTIAPTEAKLKELKKTYDFRIFDGAAHGFLRAQGGNNGANLKASQEAWPLTVGWIKKYAS
jgi:carboxymethylenebutenolidase